jgi:hypothetical protein
MRILQLKDQKCDNQLARDLLVASAMGDGTFSKRDGSLGICQKSPIYTLWKHSKCFQAKLCRRTVRKFHKNRPTIQSGLRTSYPLSIREVAKSIPLTYSKVTDKRLDENRGKILTHSFGFSTKKILTQDWRDAFYTQTNLKSRGNNISFRKTLPSFLTDIFNTPFALAIWYMDDGNYNPAEDSYRIAAGEWTEAEFVILQECLKVNFNIIVTLIKSKGTPHSVYLSQRSRDRFVALVKPTVKEFYDWHRSRIMWPKIKGILGANP